MAQRPPIVVGVDGSQPSEDALGWALGQAELTGSDLRVVMSWQVPSAAYWAPLPDGIDFAGDAQKALDQTLAEAVPADTRVRVVPVLTEGHPAPVLIGESQGASLLVVGSRGHGEFAGMLIGSVSEYCVTHAACPVVVVRHQAD